MLADPAVAAVAPRIVTRVETGTPPALGAYREMPLPPRPRRPRSGYRGGGPRFVRAERRSARAALGPGRSARLRRSIPLRRGRRPGLALARGRLEGALSPRVASFAPLSTRLVGVAAAAVCLRPLRCHARSTPRVSGGPHVDQPNGRGDLGARSQRPPWRGRSGCGLERYQSLEAPRPGACSGNRARRQVLLGQAASGPALARAVRRAWLPPAALVAGAIYRFGGRRARTALAVGVAGTLLASGDGRALGSPGLRGRVQGALLGLADDLAYQTGVWAGIVERRSAAALAPRVARQPGR